MTNLVVFLHAVIVVDRVGGLTVFDCYAVENNSRQLTIFRIFVHAIYHMVCLLSTSNVRQVARQYSLVGKFPRFKQSVTVQILHATIL